MDGVKEYIVHVPKHLETNQEKIVSFFGKPIIELIRCKDCAHWDSDDGVKGYCNGFNLVYRKYDADYYCATAERRTDEKKDI